MENFKITQENGIITIGNIDNIGIVVLTEEAINELETLQEDNNAYINEFLQALGDTVCFLVKTKIHWSGSFVEESEELIQQLSFLHGNFKDLKKPVGNEPPSKLEENAKRDWETKSS